MNFDKGGNISKKYEKRLAFTRNRSRNFATFKMEFFATIINVGSTTNGQ